MIDIRQPNISAKTEAEQVAQIRSYLYQLSQQLNWAFGTISAGSDGGNIVVQQQGKSTPLSKAQEAQANFADIKALIIKSADIVNAYSDIIEKKLEGQYVAVSDFGTYKEQTSQTLRETDKAVTQNFENIQIIQTAQKGTDISVHNLSGDVQTISRAQKNTDRSVKNLSGDIQAVQSSVDQTAEKAEKDLRDTAAGINAALQSLRDELENVSTMVTNAYIRTGLLYEREDGTPVYGLEVGQQTNVNGQEVFNRMARFAADKLSFYDRNGQEVAYISYNKMYITNVEIAGNLMVGKYMFDSSDGLAVKWIGG